MDPDAGDEVVVLVADDDPSVRSLLRVVLEDDGYRVVEAVDRHSALAMLHSGYPDVALLDLQMPGLTGEQVLSHTRRSAEIPVLVLSGEPRDRGKLGLRVGAHDFISKPFDPDELLARVHAATRVSQALRTCSVRQRAIAEQLSEAERLASTDELFGDRQPPAPHQGPAASRRRGPHPRHVL